LAFVAFIMKFIQVLKKIHWHYWFILLIAILFFVAVSSFNYFTQHFDSQNSNKEFVKWLSPDETANYIFTKLYAQEGRLTIFEKYNLYVHDIMHPRSFRSDLGVLKPVSFLGIILIFGKIASLFSYKIIPFLTPLFASIGLFFYYLLVKELFGRFNALLSVFLLSFFPVYVYYSARSMFHNILFVVLLVVGFYFLVIINKERSKVKICKSYIDIKKYIITALAGLFIGLAVTVRTSELFWLAPILLLIYFFNIRKTNIVQIIIFLFFVFLAFLPVIQYNQILYGCPYYGGYTEMNYSLDNIKEASSKLIKINNSLPFSRRIDLIYKIKNSLFPFGIDLNKSFKMFCYYFVDMFPFLFWGGVLGLVIFFKNPFKHQKKHFVFLLVYLIFSYLLILYYGSWDFHDNPDHSQHTIGNSYTRYWLPIYLGAIPFASLFLEHLTKKIIKIFSCQHNTFRNKLNSKLLAPAFLVAVISLIVFNFITFVLWGSDEGLIYSVQKQNEARREFKRVMNLTENNAVIITFYHDKLFFPQRKVVVGLFNDKNMVAQYAVLAKYLPVYYYNFTLPPEAINYLNERRLKEVGLQIEQISRINYDFTLYKLNLVEK